MPRRGLSSIAVTLAIALALASDAIARDPPHAPRKSAGRTTASTGPNTAPTRVRDSSAKVAALEHEKARVEHRAAIAAVRKRMPRRPIPGEPGFTGVPPAGERRFVPDEMVLHVSPTVSAQKLDDAARKLGLTRLASQTVGLTGGTLIHFRAVPGRPVAELVRALEAEKIGIAQPNYVFKLQQDATLSARSKGGDPGQYVVSKLHLGEAHRLATGSNVSVAVIDSEIDSRHPDLAGAVIEQFDAVGRADRPHSHGTGMAGAIAARRTLLGIAPAVRVFAIHAFSPDSGESPQATTSHVIAGLEWAIKKGARVINMSFAGPYDPLLQLALKKAHAKGIVLIAAAGNLGASSPPLYPAADPHVIAVTATDQNDRLFAQANRGAYVALAAPGVDILEPAPSAGYQVTTGTSVAAAHVSGVAALLIERDPSLTPDAVFEILTGSAKRLGGKGHDDRFGWGLVDPTHALREVEARSAQAQRRSPAAPGAAAVSAR
jgi:subtilisin family serine protease